MGLLQRMIIILVIAGAVILSILLLYNRATNDIIDPIVSPKQYQRSALSTPTTGNNHTSHTKKKFNKHNFFHLNTQQRTQPTQQTNSTKQLFTDQVYKELRDNIKKQREQKPQYHDNRGNTKQTKAIQQQRDRLNKNKHQQRGTNRRPAFRARSNTASRFKDDYQYCDMSNISTVSQFLIQHNSQIDTLTPQKIEQLKTMRITKPKACNPSRENPSYLQKWNINLEEKGNLVPFINRCNVKAYYQQPDLFEYYAGSNTKAAYMHVFKSGGTTVIQTWENMQRNLGVRGPHKAMKVHHRQWKPGKVDLPREIRWIGDRNNFYRFFDGQYSFSYVRDPVGRFLSSFFEYKVRADDHVEEKYMNKIHDGDHTPQHLLKELAFIMQHRTVCEYDTRYKRYNYLPRTLNIYWDDHLNPQMHFLLNDNWDKYKLNYVGDMSMMQETLYKIMVEYSDINVDELDFDTFKKKYYHLERDRHTKAYQEANNPNKWPKQKKMRNTGQHDTQNIITKNLVLERKDMDDELIQLICELYWLDYLCLPFDIPKQCNITQLFLQHYGNDVVYDDCYK